MSNKASPGCFGGCHNGSAEYEDGTDYQLSGKLPVNELLAAALRKMPADMMASQVGIGSGQELPLMPLMHKWGQTLPFLDVLNAINTSYRDGLA